jgi:CRP/FNR family transcriptional regulator, cyclic AMP receptor protein
VISYESVSGSGDAPRMSKVEREVATLLSAKNGLNYLTVNDWTLLADKAVRVQFNKGDFLVKKGKASNGIYLLLKGTAKVQLLSQAVRTIGPGEICGDMSFLEDAAASADVIADESLETYHLDRPTLQGLFELFPHLGSRFYRSLATNLSRRLRDVLGSSAEITAQSPK